MQFCAVRRPVLIAAAPRLALRVLVESGHTPPGGAAVFGAEQALRRGPGVPHTRLARVSGRQPECVVDGPVAAFAERGRLLGFVPAAAAVRGAKNRRPELAGGGPGKHRLAVARVGDAVVHDMAKELRPGDAPAAARGVAVQLPQALARRAEQTPPNARHLRSLRHDVLLHWMVAIGTAEVTLSRTRRQVLG